MNKLLQTARDMKDSGIEWIGEIPKEWGVKRAKNIFRLVTGATPKSDMIENWGNDVTWVTPMDFKSKYLSFSTRSLSWNGYNSCGTTLVPQGSIVISCRAPIGSVALSKVELCFNQGCKALVKRQSDIVENYFYYYFAVNETSLNLFGRGTTFLELSSTALNDFPLPYPPLAEQEAIANYLDIQVEKIEKLIAEQKQAIESWKSYKQSLITETVTKGLNPNVEMKESGFEWIGEIPKEWEVVPLKKVCVYQEGPGIMSVDFEDSGIPLIRISGMKGNTVSLNGCNYLNPEKVKQKWEHFKLDLGDILISASASTGIVATVDKNTVGCIPYTGLIRFKAGSKITNSYLKYFIESDIYTEQINIQKTGTTIHHYGPSHLGKVKFVLPPFNEQEAIAKFLDAKVQKIDEAIEDKETLIKQLEVYKQSLIYEYVTGKKSVI